MRSRQQPWQGHDVAVSVLGALERGCVAALWHMRVTATSGAVVSSRRFAASGAAWGSGDPPAPTTSRRYLSQLLRRGGRELVEAPGDSTRSWTGKHLNVAQEIAQGAAT